MKLEKSGTGFRTACVGLMRENFDWTECEIHPGDRFCCLEIPDPPAAGPGSVFRIIGLATPVVETTCKVFFWRMRQVGGTATRRANASGSCTGTSGKKTTGTVWNGPGDAGRDARKREMRYQHDLGVSRIRRILARAAWARKSPGRCPTRGLPRPCGHRRGGNATAKAWGATFLAVAFGDPEAFFAEAVSRETGGTIHGLVNIGAIATGIGGIPHNEIDIWDRVQRVNAHGTWVIARACGPMLKEPDDAVVAVNSLLAYKPEPNIVCTAAARAGVQNLLKSLGVELAPWVRVNSVPPGLIGSRHFASVRINPSGAPTGTARWRRKMASRWDVCFSSTGTAADNAASAKAEERLREVLGSDSLLGDAIYEAVSQGATLGCACDHFQLGLRQPPSPAFRSPPRRTRA